MTLPFAFLAGLFAVFACRELSPDVPGSRSVPALVIAALSLAVPTVLAAWANRLASVQLATGRRGLVPPRAVLSLSAAAVPLTMYLVFVRLHYSDFIDEVAWDSHLGRMLLCALPLFVAELPRIVFATPARLLAEMAIDSDGFPQPFRVRLREFAPLVRLHFGWPLLLLLPIVLLGLGLDLLAIDRGAYAFVLGTSVGTTLGTILFLLVTFVLFPFWFRAAFGVDAVLPEPIGTHLRATAAALGFSPSRVLLMPTGMRAMNAMMVGPLPFGRCLCITDGLFTALDGEALAGVVAHEVGHARMGHPRLLLTLVMVVPLLLLVPLRLVDTSGVDVVLQASVGVTVFVVIWCIARALARRFEHEADVASVQALGAGPCTRALLVVSRMALPVTHARLTRLLSLHPDERSRALLMQRYEVDPGFRAEFDQKGRRLRRAIGAAVLIALSSATWGWTSDWPLERLQWNFNVGDFVAAKEQIERLHPVPPRWRDSVRTLTEDLDVVMQIAPEARDWATAQPLLAAGAWPRAVQALLNRGPAAARPWCLLALSALDRPTDLQRAVTDYCVAAVAEDTARMQDIVLVLWQRGVPAELAPVFANGSPPPGAMR